MRKVRHSPGQCHVNLGVKWQTPNHNAARVRAQAYCLYHASEAINPALPRLSRCHCQSFRQHCGKCNILDHLNILGDREWYSCPDKLPEVVCLSWGARWMMVCSMIQMSSSLFQQSRNVMTRWISRTSVCLTQECLSICWSSLQARKGCTPTEGSKICAYYGHVSGPWCI